MAYAFAEIKNGITLLNAPGTIDCDYRGPVGVILSNFGHEPFFVHRGDRIAQMVVAKVERAVWKEVASLDDTPRGEGGLRSGRPHTARYCGRRVGASGGAHPP